MNKRIVISVISDFVNDQRVQKVATTLHNAGYQVMVIAVRKKASKDLPELPFLAKRIKLFFQKGFLFYAEWNIRLFFYLCFQKADVLVANDLDTLLPNFLHSKVRKAKLVYDSHEYFTEQEELQRRNFVKSVWLFLERVLFPRLKNVYTVNNSIAKVYNNLYGIPVNVFQNLPKSIVMEEPAENMQQLFLETLATKKILLSQGTGFNANRGLEELIDAVKTLPADYVLVIIGKGLVLEKLKEKAVGFDHKIYFLDTVNPAQLKWITTKCYLGFSLDKATCLNYIYSLPNKIFDFIQAGVPIIASNRVEVATVVNTKFGIVLDDVTPLSITKAIIGMDEHLYISIKNNMEESKEQYTWESQEKRLLDFYNNLN